MHMKRLKTKDVIALYGSHAEVARVLKIAAPSTFGKSWNPHVPILRTYQLREIRPTIDKEIEQQRSKR